MPFDLRVPHMPMRINEPGRHDLARAVNDGCGGLVRVLDINRGSYASDRGVLDEKVRFGGYDMTISAMNEE